MQIRLVALGSSSRVRSSGEQVESKQLEPESSSSRPNKSSPKRQFYKSPYSSFIILFLFQLVRFLSHLINAFPVSLTLFFTAASFISR